MRGPVAAYGLYDGQWQLAWVPCKSMAVARRLAQASVAGGEATRYTLYNSDGLAVEEGVIEDDPT